MGARLFEHVTIVLARCGLSNMSEVARAEFWPEAMGGMSRRIVDREPSGLGRSGANLACEFSFKRRRWRCSQLRISLHVRDCRGRSRMLRRGPYGIAEEFIVLGVVPSEQFAFCFEVTLLLGV